MPHREGRLTGQVKIIKQFMGSTVELLPVSNAELARLPSEKDVFRDAQVFDERKLLIDNGNAGMFGFPHVREATSRPIAQKLAAIFRMRTSADKYVYQSRLARAIFANEGMNPSAIEIE